MSPPVEEVPRFKGKVAIGLGITMVVMGLLSFIAEAIARGYDGAVNISLTGVWIGIFFIINGGIGIGAGLKKSKCLVVSFMVLSIISSVLAASLVSYASIAIIIQLVSGSGRYGDENYQYTTTVVIATMPILIISGLVMFVIAIIASAFCCAGICCGNTASQGQVLYVPQAQTGQVIVAQGYVPPPGPTAYPPQAQGFYPSAPGAYPTAPPPASTKQAMG